MPPTAPDPVAIRTVTIEELSRLGIPLPPDHFPLVWEPGDQVGLRPVEEIEARAAVLNVVLSRIFGMPHDEAMQWLLDARLLDQISAPEWQFIVGGHGDRDTFALHLEALFALSWLLGFVEHLDPSLYCSDGIPKLFPNLPDREPYGLWRSRTLPAPREPGEAAALLDMYYCLDFTYQDARRRGTSAPGPVEAYVVGQRRWALEWAVVFTGPYHEPPPGWEDVDLSI